MLKLLWLILLAACFKLSTTKYLIPNFTANWFKAAEYCHHKGAELVTVTNAQKYNEIKNAVKGSEIYNTAHTEFWIAANDLAEEGHFYWHSTGTRVQFTKWMKQQPDGSSVDENCVEVRNIPAYQWNWAWNDLDCKKMRYFVCEFTESVNQISTVRKLYCQ